MNLLLQACNAANVDLPKTGSDMIKYAVCDETNVNCMLTGNYESCANCKVFHEEISSVNDEIMGDTVTWYQWQINDRVVKTVQEGTVGKLLQQIHSQLPHFLRHCIVKRK